MSIISKLHNAVSRLMTNAESESFYDVHEVSEPVFWLAFSLVLSIAAIFTAIKALVRQWSKLG